ncbi:MAG: hypothetical protein LBB31_00425 [Prevotellaceae bacterium]|jgi:hypothetical protein|nr:hypothetical protein [Prevotellaceae bacterium]
MQFQQIIHYVHAHHLRTEYPEAQAAIIGTGSHKPIIEALMSLYAHRHTTPVLHIECAESDVAGLVNDCRQRNVVAVIVGNARFLPDAQPFSAAVVAPSANMRSQELYRQVLEHPQLDIFSVIGFQTYLTATGDMEWLHEQGYETLRLGSFRDCPAEAEPLIREAHHVFFDLNALRSSDAPETHLLSPNGMYAEELCQLAAYSGRSPKLQSFRLFNFLPTLAPTALTAQTAAQTLWHLLEGIAVRHQTHTNSSAHVKKIIVDAGENGQSMEFLHDTITGYWWLQIPLAGGEHRYIACLQEDYSCACRREVPARWLHYFQKFNSKPRGER